MKNKFKTEIDWSKNSQVNLSSYKRKKEKSLRKIYSQNDKISMIF